MTRNTKENIFIGIFSCILLAVTGYTTGGLLASEHMTALIEYKIIGRILFMIFITGLGIFLLTKK